MQIRKIDYYFNASFLLLIIIPLYFLQNELGIDGAPLLALWLMIDVLYVVKEFYSKKTDRLSKIIVFFWFFNMIYWVFSPKKLIGEGISYNTIEYMKNISIALLTYFPFLNMSRSKIIDESYMRIFLIMELIIAIINYYGYEGTIMANTGKEYVTNNISYRFVAALPLLGLFFRKKYALYLLLLVCMYFVILGAKRGAIISMVLMMTVFVYFFFRDNAVKNKFRAVILSVVSLGILSFFVYYTYQGNEYLQFRIDGMREGSDESGDLRVYYYHIIWETWKQSDVSHLLFGYGFNQSISIAGNYAHNDWLEIMADFGLVGICLYATFLWNMWKRIRISCRFLDDEYKYVIISAFLMILSKAIYSMSYVSMTTAFAMGAIGFVHSSAENNKLIINQNQS